MIELLAEICALCWKLLKADLPDCRAVLRDLHAGKRLVPKASDGFMWICYLTATAKVIRGVTVFFISLAISLLLLHFSFRWPPFSFEPDPHEFFVELSSHAYLPPTPIHICGLLAIASMTSFIALALSYNGYAWFARQLVQVIAP